MDEKRAGSSGRDNLPCSRPLRSTGLEFSMLKQLSRGHAYLVWNGWFAAQRKIFRRLFPAAAEVLAGFEYPLWMWLYDRRSPSDRKQIGLHIEQLARPPRISLLIPIRHTAEWKLRCAIDSVLNQLYPDWELLHRQWRVHGRAGGPGRHRVLTAGSAHQSRPNDDGAGRLGRMQRGARAGNGGISGSDGPR